MLKEKSQSVKKTRITYTAYLAVSAVLFARQYSTFPILDDFVYFLWFDSTDTGSLHHLLNPGSGYFWVRPVALLICYIQHTLFGVFMPGYRIAGIAWHAGNALLVHHLALKSLHQLPKTAFITGLLFLCHPAAVQSVCYPSGQSEAIYLFFLLTALIQFIDYYSHSGNIKSLITGLIFLTLALFTKETAFVLVPITIGMVLLGNKDRLSLIKASILAATLSFAGVLYVFFRQSLYAGPGGYGFDITAPHTSGNVAVALLNKVFVELPAIHFFPLSPEDLNYTWAVRAGLFVLTVIVVFSGFRSRQSTRCFVSALLILVLSNIMLAMVFLHHPTELLAPRYMYLGSVGVALILGPLFCRQTKMRIPLIILILILWITGQHGHQRDFYRAGQVTEYVLTTTDHYCHHLEEGGRIVLHDIPERIGAISINISHERDTVFNLEAHRRCGLAPLMDMSRGQGEDNWNQFMNQLPGRVSVFHFPDVSIPATPGTLVFSLDIQDAYSTGN
jgi:hypothetical protein